MSALTNAVELDTAIAEYELTEEETETLRAVIAEGMPLEEAVAAVLADRQGAGPKVEREVEREELGDEPTPRQYRELEREAARHTEAVRSIMGPFAEGMVECERCNGIGLHEPGPTPRTHEFFKACPTCNGFGEVITGSLHPGDESRACPACKGRGYLEQIGGDGQPLADASGSHVAAPIVQPQAANGSEGAEPAAPAAEPTWGTPAWMGDPSLGR